MTDRPQDVADRVRQLQTDMQFVKDTLPGLLRNFQLTVQVQKAQIDILEARITALEAK